MFDSCLIVLVMPLVMFVPFVILLRLLLPLPFVRFDLFRRCVPSFLLYLLPPRLAARRLPLLVHALRLALIPAFTRIVAPLQIA